MRCLFVHLLFAAAIWADGADQSVPHPNRGWLLARRETASPQPAGEGKDVAIIRIKGAIGPATADYIARAVRVASENERECLIIHLDTPGGLLDSTKDIVQTFYSSSVPTV